MGPDFTLCSACVAGKWQDVPLETTENPTCLEPVQRPGKDCGFAAVSRGAPLATSGCPVVPLVANCWIRAPGGRFFTDCRGRAKFTPEPGSAAGHTGGGRFLFCASSCALPAGLNDTGGKSLLGLLPAVCPAPCQTCDQKLESAQRRMSTDRP